ncbi:hypothetical protein D3C72_1444520 [compost metagenome]
MQFLRRARAEFGNLGCRGQALYRLRRRHRRAQHRPPPSAPGRSRREAAGALHAHGLPDRSLCQLYRAGREDQPSCAGAFRQEDRLLHHRRRSGGKRHQDRPRGHRPARRDRLLRRLPRPHHDGHGADRQGRAVQDRLRAVPGRGLPRAVSVCAAWRQHRGLAQGAAAPVQGGHRSQARGGHHLRTRAGRGRLQRGAGRFRARAARGLRRARHPADRR